MQRRFADDLDRPVHARRLVWPGMVEDHPVGLGLSVQVRKCRDLLGVPVQVLVFQ
jgi:hypothetical protein